MASKDGLSDSSSLSSLSSISSSRLPEHPSQEQLPPAQDSIHVAQHRPRYSSPPESPASPPDNMAARTDPRKRRKSTPSETSTALKKRNHSAAFKKTAGASPAGIKKAKAASKKFHPDVVLTSTKSPLAGADIRVSYPPLGSAPRPFCFLPGASACCSPHCSATSLYHNLPTTYTSTFLSIPGFRIFLYPPPPRPQIHRSIP